MKRIAILSIFSLILTFSCTEPTEDITQQVNKDAAIEVELTTKHCEYFDILTTVERVWVKNSLVKTLYRIDTIPYLGFTTADGTTSDGRDTLVTVQKDYEFYITIK